MVEIASQMTSAEQRKLRINVEQSNFSDGKTNSVAGWLGSERERAKISFIVHLRGTQPFPIKFITRTKVVSATRRLPPVTKFGAS